MTGPFGTTAGPWKWQGEDYRGGWGWQMLVDANGSGLIIGQDSEGKVSEYVRAHQPADAAACITGMAALGAPHAAPVHVFSSHNARAIAQVPAMLELVAYIAAMADKGGKYETGPLPNFVEDACAIVAELEKEQ